jgi:hypothetical protein
MPVASDPLLALAGDFASENEVPQLWFNLGERPLLPPVAVAVPCSVIGYDFFCGLLDGRLGPEQA